MMFILAALILQAGALPPETWKERNHSDMPAIPACKRGRQGSSDKIAKLPKDVSDELKRFFGPDGGLSEANGPFNSTDVHDGRVPSRRFLRAYHIGKTWVVWYEHGGFFHNLQTIALAPRPGSNSTSEPLRIQPGTTFFGNLCAATTAIVGGVRTGAP